MTDTTFLTLHKLDQKRLNNNSMDNNIMVRLTTIYNDVIYNC